MKNFFIKEKLLKTFGLGINRVTGFSKTLGLNLRKSPMYVKKKHINGIKVQCKKLILNSTLKKTINKQKDILKVIQTDKYSRKKNV